MMVQYIVDVAEYGNLLFSYDLYDFRYSVVVLFTDADQFTASGGYFGINKKQVFIIGCFIPFPPAFFTGWFFLNSRNRLCGFFGFRFSLIVRR